MAAFCANGVDSNTVTSRRFVASIDRLDDNARTKAYSPTSIRPTTASPEKYAIQFTAGPRPYVRINARERCRCDLEPLARQPQEILGQRVAAFAEHRFWMELHRVDPARRVRDGLDDPIGTPRDDPQRCRQRGRIQAE